MVFSQKSFLISIVLRPRKTLVGQYLATWLSRGIDLAVRWLRKVTGGVRDSYGRTGPDGQHLAKTALLFLAMGVLFLGRSLFPAPGEVLGGYDMRGYYHILHMVFRQALSEGRLPFWSPYLFNGFPLLADPQVGTFYPPAWLTLILPVNVAISWYMLFHIWLAAVGMYLTVRILGGRPLPAILAGIIFAYSGLLGGRLWAGHSTVYATDAWTPWLVLALIWAVRQRRWPAAVLAGTVFGFGLLAGHLPSFLYVGLIWLAFVCYLALTEKGQRRTVIRQATIMAGVGFALAAIQLVPFLQFSASTARVATADFEFASEYSLPPAHLITLILPQFFGEPTRVGYWSVPTFEELTYYAGVLVFLGIALTLARPTRLGWFYLGFIAFGLWLALGRYGLLYKLIYDWLPPLRVVRAPARAAFLYSFLAAALMGHVLSDWQKVPLSRRTAALRPVLRWVLSLWAVAGVTAIAATGAVFMAVHPTDTSGRLWEQIGGYSQAVVIFLLGGGVVVVYLTSRQEDRRKRLSGIALILLTTVDMWLFSYKFVRLEPAAPDPVWTDAKAVIDSLQSEGSDLLSTGRVLPWGLPVFSQNGGVQVKLPSMFGYESLEPAAHIALTSSVPDPRSSAYDLLATKFVIGATPLDQFTGEPNGLAIAGHQGQAWVYQRPNALPVARLVYDVEVIVNNQEAIERIHQPDFSAARTAVVANPPSCPVGPMPVEPGSAHISQAAEGFWRIETDSPAPALLILAESAYPGWQVTVDGHPAAPLTAYTTTRAVCVPAGKHVVAWSFRPQIFWLGAGLSGLALSLVLVAGWVARSRSRFALEPDEVNQAAV